MDPLLVARVIWSSPHIPRLVLEICFISLLRHVDWFPVLNETVLYSILYALGKNSVMSAFYLLLYETSILVVVYWNPYELLYRLCPQSIRLFFPEAVIQGMIELLKCIDVAAVEVFWRLSHEEIGYPDRFNVKYKSMAFLFVTFCILASPYVVCLFYICRVVGNYFLFFDIKTLHDLVVFCLLGMIYWSTENRPCGVYIYLYVITTYVLILVWFVLKFPYMISVKDRARVFRVEIIGQ